MKKKLEENGKILHGGTVIDATIIEALSATKNSSHGRDPEMHQTKKGNGGTSYQWHFGMKAHVGVNARSGMVHRVATTSAQESDIASAHKLIRADDDFVNADAGYVGIEKREEIKNDEVLSKIEYRVNEQKGRIKQRANA